MVSFANRVKSEICRSRPLRQIGKKALAYAFLLYGKTFGEDSISIHTEHHCVARLYADCIAEFVELTGLLTVREIPRADRRSIFQVTVDEAIDRRAVLDCFGYQEGEMALQIREELLGEEKIFLPAFISGVFLACAAVSDPEKEYHVEFSTPHRALCDGLQPLLSERLASPKATVRRNDYLLYYKESDAIEDLLTCVGAPRSSMELMEVKMVKGLRNRVNRETNCETANLSKTIDAALTQIEGIRLIEATCGLEVLGDELRELATLRRDNPDLSLRELAEQLSLSRSGVNHRLRRIEAFAAELRG